MNVKLILLYYFFSTIFLLPFSDEKCLTFLTVLTYLLPPMPGSRCSVKSAISFLVDFVPVCFKG